jgi:hypothetical protein
MISIGQLVNLFTSFAPEGATQKPSQRICNSEAAVYSNLGAN